MGLEKYKSNYDRAIELVRIAHSASVADCKWEEAVEAISDALDEAEDRTQKAICKMAADWADDRKNADEKELLGWFSATLHEMGPVRNDQNGG